MATENIPKIDKLIKDFGKQFTENVRQANKTIEELKRGISQLKEDNGMLHKVTVTKTEEKVLKEYYAMRGIKKQYDGLGNEKEVVYCEREVSQYPDLGTIAQFLNECGADFVTVEHNYRFEPDLPFC